MHMHDAVPIARVHRMMSLDLLYCGKGLTGTSLGREGEGETERVLGFKMRRFDHSETPERITIRVDYRCSPSAAFTQDTRFSTEIQYCTGIIPASSMNCIYPQSRSRRTVTIGGISKKTVQTESKIP